MSFRIKVDFVQDSSIVATSATVELPLDLIGATFDGNYHATTRQTISEYTRDVTKAVLSASAVDNSEGVRPKAIAAPNQPLQAKINQTNKVATQSALRQPATTGAIEGVPMVTIRIFSSTKHEYNVRLPRSALVADIYQFISEQEKVSVQTLRVLFDGYRAGSDQSLEELEVEDGDRFHVATELMGS